MELAEPEAGGWVAPDAVQAARPSRWPGFTGKLSHGHGWAPGPGPLAGRVARAGWGCRGPGAVDHSGGRVDGMGGGGSYGVGM